MITNSMNYQEIVRELNSEIDVADNYISKKLLKPFQKAVRSASKYPVIKCYDYTTPLRKNKMLIILKANKRSDASEPKTTFVASCDTDKGPVSYFIDRHNLTKVSVAAFLPHVFKRYRERYVKDASVTREEVRKMFFAKNSLWVPRKIDASLCPFSKELNEGCEYKCAYLSEDGVCFVEMQSEIMVFKTFVPYDMLYQNQLDVLLPLKERYYDGAFTDNKGNRLKKNLDTGETENVRNIYIMNQIHRQYGNAV